VNAKLPHELEERPQSRREWSGWLPSVVLPLMLVSAIVGGLFYFDSRGGGGNDDGYGTVTLPPEHNQTGESPAARVGRAAPDFFLETLDGGELRLSDLQGTPVIVNFFATWCVSCRHETPALVSFNDANGNNVAVIGVDLQESDSLVRSYAEEFGIEFHVVMDRDGEVARTWQIGGPVEGVPSTYFIDGSGVVQKVVFGIVRADDLAEGLDLITASARSE
jgi:peroxiredoxin